MGIILIKLESITEHVVVDTKLQKKTRSSVIGAISLEKYSIAIDCGNSLKIGSLFHQALETYFDIPIKNLFLTHSHSDHRCGMEAFKDNILLFSEKTKVNMPTSVRFSKYNVKTFEEKLVLEENDLKVEFIKVGGHTIGSSIAYFPYEKVLFGGDLFFIGSGNFGLPFMSLYRNKPKMTGNPEEYLTAFNKFLKMDLKIIVPGHGDLMYKPCEYLESQIRFFSALKEHFETAIADGKNLEEIKMPQLEPITQAYTKIETEANRGKAKRFLDHYLDLLKISFYNYYSKNNSFD